MNFSDYQKQAHKTSLNTTINGDPLIYPILKLAGEAGEVAELMGKAHRDHEGKIDRDRLTDELGDVLWYINEIATQAGITLEHVAQRNLNKLADRQARGVIKGSGDNR